MSEENILSRWFKPEDLKSVLYDFIGSKNCNVYIKPSVAILDKSNLTLYFPCTLDKEKKELNLYLENMTFSSGVGGLRKGKIFINGDEDELGLILAEIICGQFHEYFGVSLREGSCDVKEAFHTRIAIDHHIDSTMSTVYFYITFLVECDSIYHIKEEKTPMSEYFTLDKLQLGLTKKGTHNTEHYMKHLYPNEFFNCIDKDDSLEEYEFDEEYFGFVGHLVNKLVLERKILGEEK